MASRTQIVCLCEGEKGNGAGKYTSIDPVFINRLMKDLSPSWIRPSKGSNVVRLQPCGSRLEVIRRMPGDLKACLGQGAHTTLMVWADCDHDCNDGDALKELFREEAQKQGITQEEFNQVVFIFAKDRLENWIQFLATGDTDESKEGPRVKGKDATDAAKRLAETCRSGSIVLKMPPSLKWSCQNWYNLKSRMSS